MFASSVFVRFRLNFDRAVVVWVILQSPVLGKTLPLPLVVVPNHGNTFVQSITPTRNKQPSMTQTSIPVSSSLVMKLTLGVLTYFVISVALFFAIAVVLLWGFTYFGIDPLPYLNPTGPLIPVEHLGVFF